MAYQYGEDKLIEQTAITLFEQLGWETVWAYDAETFGPDGLLGRTNKKETTLNRYVLQALEKYNPGLPEAAYQQAVLKLAEYSASKTLGDTNFDKYELLKEGVPVDYKNAKGQQIQGQRLRLFDFKTLSNNKYTAVRQLWVEGSFGYKRRPDIIGFVNGIPLLFIELKAVHKNLETAYGDNLKDYKATIPHLFHCNAFVLLSNGLDSKVGSITGKYQHFHDWKRIQEDEEGIVSLETILRGICDRSRFLDLFENFILFDTKTMGSVVKLIARNHQYIGVNKAISNFAHKQEQFKQGLISQEERQKLGVFWHTQGSGKSYSMVFFCQKIHRKFTGNYSFLIVTDRNELDTQIYGTFSGVGVVPIHEPGKKNPFSAKASSGDNLRQLLKEDKRYIFTIIHKFNFADTCTERSDLIVISDEAHRTQAGSLAINMRKALPNASFVGFTGTPLFKNDEITRRIFGDYVSIYDFKRSVDDQATVPLYYENRGTLLKLDNVTITQEMKDAIDAAELDEDQLTKLEQLFAKEYPILTAKRRLTDIAKDIVQHFCNRGYKGKAMLVCIDKITAVKMYNYLTVAFQDYIVQAEKQLPKLADDQELLTAVQNLQWIKATEIAVVVSGEQNEIDKFKTWDLDITVHREKMNTRDLETEFKEEDNPFRLAIVCAMWITGFDVPTLSTMYIDKPLKAHTLIQTIARANRISDGKNNGLIVDYIDTYQSLLDALAVYGVGDDGKGDGTKEPPIVKPTEALIEELEDTIDATEMYLKEELNFELSRLVETEGLLRLRALKDGEDAVYTNEETKKRFEVLARIIFKKHMAVGLDPRGFYLASRIEAIKALYDRLQKNTQEADVSVLMRQLQDIVDSSVSETADDGGGLDLVYANRNPDNDANMDSSKVLGTGNIIDISHLDFDLIKTLYEKLPHKSTSVASLKDQVEQRLHNMIRQNPTRIDFYTRYTEIITEYNDGKDQVRLEKVFQELVLLVQKMDAEEQRVAKEGLTPEQAAIFDLLLKPQLNTKARNEVKSVAVELLSQLKQQPLQVENWSEKNSTAADVRKLISMYLFQHLPEPYSPVDVDEKTLTLFNHFKGTYFGGGRSAYA